MRTQFIIRNTLLAAMVLALASPVLAQRGQGRGGRGPGMNSAGDRALCLAALNSLPRQDLSSTETAGLLYMTEEEKLARDVYARLHAKWGLRIFGNISQSEQRHLEAMKLLLERYGLKDPTADRPAGKFSNEGLQELYDSFAAEGERSLNAALKVGASIEDLDIRDLEKAAASTDNSDLKAVYQNLRLASENHIRNFVRQMKAAGADYAPQHMDQARYAEIIADSPRQGRGFGARGNGPGFGRGNNGNCPWLNP